MNWPDRMNTALAFIENHLKGEITTADVAKIACCSKYHFHRTFFAVFNLTCTEYIKRRKLTLAAVDLINTKKTILNIAQDYGYTSPNAFTRAFRHIHGCNPSKVRSGTAKLKAQHKIHYPMEHKKGRTMQYKIINKPAFQIVGKSKAFNFDTFVKKGRTFWKQYVASKPYQQLYQQTHGRQGLHSEAPLLSVYFPTDTAGNEEFVDVLAVEQPSDKVVTPFETFTVPGATYAEFCCSYKESMKTNRYIYNEWFASTGYQRDGNKPDVVAYFPIPFRPMNDMQIRWWIPVIPRS